MTSLNTLERCALIDLTDLPRVGFRGVDSPVDIVGSRNGDLVAYQVSCCWVVHGELFRIRRVCILEKVREIAATERGDGEVHCC